uniref:Uncharacterized protein n=1 Tax=Cacopsylla melanoneura TaxID=428564 RepID=A0A8D8M361_9HEMI
MAGNDIKHDATSQDHAIFLWSAMKEFSQKSQDSKDNTIQAHLIESCRKYLEVEEDDINVVNDKDMCPYCYSPWSNGHYQFKSKPKVKRKGKYKVTALELLCLQCKKLVKINNRKIKRSEISVKVEKTRDSGGKVSKEKKTKQNKKDEICVESTGDTLATKKEKKKKKEGSNKFEKQIPSTVPGISKEKESSKAKAAPMRDMPDNNAIKSIKGPASNDKKRMKFQKHLNKTNQTAEKPKSSLESFLSSVGNF